MDYFIVQQYFIQKVVKKMMNQSCAKQLFIVDLDADKQMNCFIVHGLIIWRTVTTVKQLTERFIKIGAFFTVMNNSQVEQLTEYFGKA